MSTAKARASLTKWYKVAEMRNGQLILGYRFNTDLVIDHTWNDSAMVDQGVTHQVDAMPVAGPFFFQINHDQPWVLYQIRCAGCAESSKGYKIRHYGLVTWTLAHRCIGRVELNHVIYQRSGTMSQIGANELYGHPWERQAHW